MCKVGKQATYARSESRGKLAKAEIKVEKPTQGQEINRLAHQQPHLFKWDGRLFIIRPCTLVPLDLLDSLSPFQPHHLTLSQPVY